MRHQKVLARSVLAIALFAAAPAFCQKLPPAPPPPPDLLAIFRKVKLTTDQIAQVKTILADYKSTAQADRKNIQTAEQALASYLKAGGTDSTQVQTLATAIGTAAAQQRTEAANVFISIYALLTAEQQQQIAALSPPPTPPQVRPGRGAAARSGR